MLIMLLPLYALYELGIVLLWLAPASAVAQGRVLRWKKSDKAVARPRQPHQTSQVSESDHAAAHSGAAASDDDGDAV